MILGLAGLVLTTSPAFAVKEGGGGAQIESAFRLRGTELIAAIAQSPEADKLCSATVMKTGLDGSKIRVVDRLINPVTGKPIVGQDLDAWTTPGDMQLLLSSWDQFFDVDVSHTGKSVDTLILHEIYRTTVLCNDNNFKISENILKLLNLSNKYSKTYTFSYPAMISGIPAKFAVCDHPLAAGPVTVKCAYVGYYYDDRVEIQAVKLNADSKEWDRDYDAQPEAEFDIKDHFLQGEGVEIQNLYKQASPDLPFIIVSDLQTGTGAYGLDPTHLNRF
jgi:hypothetical protein